jgi:erythromycin esterase-like protein
VFASIYFRFILLALLQVDWVLIGEGSHGTHEYYQLRADVTKLLIERRGFNAVATEAGAQEVCARWSVQGVQASVHTYTLSTFGS